MDSFSARISIHGQSTGVYCTKTANFLNSLNEYLFIFVGGALELLSYLLIWPAVAFVGRRNSVVLTFLVGAMSLLGVMTLQIYKFDGMF